MYTVLTGAVKNVGDFLITDRCKKLLQAHRPERRLAQLPSWEPLDEHLNQINQSKAVIIMGGPGFHHDFYPGIYKFSSNMDDINVPIIPLGLGWLEVSPEKYSEEKKFRFSEKSLGLLRKIADEIEYIACRDYMTKRVLNNNGIKNVLMTGCPVWYDIPSIGKKMVRPKEINKVVVTPPQMCEYAEQSVSVLKLIKELFPKAELYCSFHRGIDANDPRIPKDDEKINMLIKKVAELLGYKIVDAAFDLDKIKFYDDCDLHIGYRVHGHIYFLSKRKPSILINEDCRGAGASEALNVAGVNGFENRVVNNNAVEILEHYIKNELENEFARFAGVGEVIDAHYEVMKKFIKNLP